MNPVARRPDQDGILQREYAEKSQQGPKRPASLVGPMRPPGGDNRR